MDQRQTKIVEGAGLEESRLNTDFIDWLRKWGSPIMFAVAVIAGAYAAYSWWQRAQDKAFDEAHLQWQAAAASGSPDNLLRVARENSKRGAVPILATLDAADIYLAAGLRGIAPGGNAETPTDKLSDEDTRKQFDLARGLYSDALALIGSEPKNAIHRFNAQFGLAAALASMGDTADADRVYSEIATSASNSGFPGFAAQAKKQSEWLARAASLPQLASRDAIKPSARPVEEAPTTPIELPPELQTLPAGPEGPSPEPASASPEPAPATPEPVTPPQ